MANTSTTAKVLIGFAGVLTYNTIKELIYTNRYLSFNQLEKQIWDRLVDNLGFSLNRSKPFTDDKPQPADYNFVNAFNELPLREGISWNTLAGVIVLKAYDIYITILASNGAKDIENVSDYGAFDTLYHNLQLAKTKYEQIMDQFN